VSFDVAAEADDGFRGRSSRRCLVISQTSLRFRPGLRVLAVGRGTGALTSERVARLGPDAVAAVMSWTTSCASAASHRGKREGVTANGRS